MINLTILKGMSHAYPENIEGTYEWYYCKGPAESVFDLYDAQEIYQRDGFIKGYVHHLIHYPDGEVHSPFQVKDNIFVDKPVWNNGELHFLVVDFQQHVIRITKYIPEKRIVVVIAQLSLSEVKDCYNLILETTPLTLGRSGNEGFYEIIWPEKKKIAIGKTESVLFRVEEKLYLSQWVEDPDYHENVIIRNIQTGEIIESFEGSIHRMPNNVYWQIK